MLKIYGHPMSTCTRKVLMTLAETNTPSELVARRLRQGRAQGRAAPCAASRSGASPAIDDDGFELFESRAICRYLNEKASGKLVPATPRGAPRWSSGSASRRPSSPRTR